MFRRPLRWSIQRFSVGMNPPALQRANQLMASGQYAEAASIYEQFANGALARKGPRAPWLFLQAGQARLQAGQVQAGMAHLQRGLVLLAKRGQFQRLYHAGNRIVAELKAHGLTAEAQRIDTFLKTNLPAGFLPGPGSGSGRSGPLLPTNCPACGATLRLDEVEWADKMTAECPYCGSAVRAQE